MSFVIVLLNIHVILNFQKFLPFYLLSLNFCASYFLSKSITTTIFTILDTKIVGSWGSIIISPPTSHHMVKV